MRTLTKYQTTSTAHAIAERKLVSEKAGTALGKQHGLTEREVKLLFSDIDSDCSGLVTKEEVLEFFELEGSDFDQDTAASMRMVLSALEEGGMGHGGLSLRQFIRCTTALSGKTHGPHLFTQSKY